ncbi:MAG: ABC transporter substrate-binding protein [Nocardioides sp.]|uniref:ABC transporter substrate-binding protein n=1 Tax=Nocardioides sp. TaxID=35761 RepID=UPI0039E45D10
MNQIASAVVSRRSLLQGAGALSVASMLGMSMSACSSDSSSGGKFTGNLTFLLPGTVPTGWQNVQSEINKRLKKDLGFTIQPQFISWADYGTQSLLRFTSGAKFDTALQARWLNMAQLASDKALVDVGSKVGSYKNLSATIDPKILESNHWGDALYGIPQVNSAARLHHFGIRQDLAEELGFGEINDFETLERFFYAVRQKKSGMIPLGLNTNSSKQTTFGPVTPILNAWAWENPNAFGWSFTGDSMLFAFAADAGTSGSSNPIPFWEQDGVRDALDRVRKYNQDGIINKDILNLDATAEQGLFTSGKTAATWAITDGTTSNYLTTLKKAVPTAAMANIAPLKGGLSAKPLQNFQADNFVVLNTHGQSNDSALALQDWASIKQNYDLISYGIEGTDWVAQGENGVEFKSSYNFPAFALSWRIPLFRSPSTMSETEKQIFDWSKDTDNFTLDPFAAFIPDVEPVKSENTQMTAVMTQYAKPLFAGVVDVDKGLDALKKAADRAGIDKLQAELAKQADAYAKAHQ